MIIPVKCFTCGKVLGDKYLYYLKEIAEEKNKKSITDDNIQYLTDDSMDKSIEGVVLDKLKLNRQCCRRHMLTHVDVF
tara:strand:+ start:12877 stop:13110 length:234 start_codon:yes stop_codon:yes gene_type:complete